MRGFCAALRRDPPRSCRPGLSHGRGADRRRLPSARRLDAPEMEPGRVPDPLHLHRRSRKPALDHARRHDDAHRLRRPPGVDSREKGGMDSAERQAHFRRMDRALRGARQPRRDDGRLSHALAPPRGSCGHGRMGRWNPRMERRKTFRERLPAGGRHSQVQGRVRPRLAELRRADP